MNMCRVPIKCMKCESVVFYLLPLSPPWLAEMAGNVRAVRGPSGPGVWELVLIGA